MKRIGAGRAIAAIMVCLLAAMIVHFVRIGYLGDDLFTPLRRLVTTIRRPPSSPSVNPMPSATTTGVDGGPAMRADNSGGTDANANAAA